MSHHHGLRAISVPDLADLEARFQQAFVTGDPAGLEMLGAGEISLVVGWASPDGMIACKRLPPFRNQRKLRAYSEVFHDYLSRLGEAGVNLVPTTLITLGDNGAYTAFAIQPRLDEAELLPVLFRQSDSRMVAESFDEILVTLDRVLRRGLGLDAQLSNWARRKGVLLYLDVTTPFLRDASGSHRLDTSVFTASLPWVIRGLVTGFLSQSIMDAYFVRRTVVLDLLGNLIKERLRPLIPVGLERANLLLEEPVTAADVERHYVQDARLWALLQRLRRWDRLWQLKVRRRPYPHLLPGPIER